MQHACVMARSFHIWPLPVFTCTQERACTRCAATYAREHQPRRVSDGGRENARGLARRSMGHASTAYSMRLCLDCCSSYDYREIKGGKDKGWTRGLQWKKRGGKKKAASV